MRGSSVEKKLQPGLASEFRFPVPENKTVPFVYTESPEFQLMPRVLASPFPIGLIEWACVRAVNPHIDWSEEQTVGTGFHLSRLAATPPGLAVTVRVRLEKVEGKQLTFSIVVDDGMDTVAEGAPEKHIIDAARFNARAAAKQDQGGRPEFLDEYDGLAVV